MTEARPAIACLGAGRMGRGIAVAFAYAGHGVTMIDVKPRSAEQFAKLQSEALDEVRKTLASLTRFGLLNSEEAEAVIARVSVVPSEATAKALSQAGLVFEGVPEVVELKRDVLSAASQIVGSSVIIASTTSTILVDDLSGVIEHPERFLNVHWLNPAYLIPLVEISPGKRTDPAVTENIKALLGNVPVFGICLGHQIMSLALGAETFKLRFGHHGGNHPVRHLATGRVEITSQNHNYAVDATSLPDGSEVTHLNLNDGDVEGVRSEHLRAFSVQYHPEAGPGPHDARYLFEEFTQLMRAG